MQVALGVLRRSDGVVSSGLCAQSASHSSADFTSRREGSALNQASAAEANLERLERREFTILLLLR